MCANGGTTKGPNADQLAVFGLAVDIWSLATWCEMPRRRRERPMSDFPEILPGSHVNLTRYSHTCVIIEVVLLACFVEALLRAGLS